MSRLEEIKIKDMNGKKNKLGLIAMVCLLASNSSVASSTSHDIKEIKEK